MCLLPAGSQVCEVEFGTIFTTFRWHVALQVLKLFSTHEKFRLSSIHLQSMKRLLQYGQYCLMRKSHLASACEMATASDHFLSQMAPRGVELRFGVPIRYFTKV